MFQRLARVVQLLLEQFRAMKVRWRTGQVFVISAAIALAIFDEAWKQYKDCDEQVDVELEISDEIKLLVGVDLKARSRHAWAETYYSPDEWEVTRMAEFNPRFIEVMDKEENYYSCILDDGVRARKVDTYISF